MRKPHKIEHKDLKLRIKINCLTRNKICFAKSEKMHDLLIELFIDRYEFGLNWVLTLGQAQGPPLVGLVG